jgi:hypothetical protein
MNKLMPLEKIPSKQYLELPKLQEQEETFVFSRTVTFNADQDLSA